MKLSKRIASDNVPLWMQVLELLSIAMGILLELPIDGIAWFLDVE